MLLTGWDSQLTSIQLLTCFTRALKHWKLVSHEISNRVHRDVNVTTLNVSVLTSSSLYAAVQRQHDDAQTNTDQNNGTHSEDPVLSPRHVTDARSSDVFVFEQVLSDSFEPLLWVSFCIAADIILMTYLICVHLTLLIRSLVIDSGCLRRWRHPMSKQTVGFRHADRQADKKWQYCIWKYPFPLLYSGLLHKPLLLDWWFLTAVN